MAESPADRWQRLRSLLDRALDLDDAARRAYLESLRGNEDLRDDLQRLLAAHRRIEANPLRTAIDVVLAALTGEIRDRATEGGDDRGRAREQGR